MFQVETINGKTILPIWHNLTKKQVTEYSPIIADRKAMTTALMTPAEIAEELKKLFKPNSMEDVDNDNEITTALIGLENHRRHVPLDVNNCQQRKVECFRFILEGQFQI